MRIERDYLKHFGVCLIVAFLASALEAVFYASPTQSFLAGIIAGGAIGVGKEYGDECAEGNKWDWNDIAADMAGAALGAVLGALLSLVIH